MKRPNQPRAAFTLVELLVVIGIIVLLASLTVSAVFRVRESQREANTSTHVRKIWIGFEQQWKAAVDKIKMEDPPQPVKDITASGTPALPQYDNTRARALHMKLRLRQEFPQNFTEARTGITVTSPINGATYTYAPLSTYWPPGSSVIKDAKGPIAGHPEWPSDEVESAALLVIILGQTRGGISFDVDGAAPTQVFDFSRVQVPPLPAPPAGSTLPFKVYVDPYGSPIAFRRAAGDNQMFIAAELSQTPFVTQAQVNSGNMDPQDPEGRLKMNTWAGKAMATSYFSTAPLSNPFDGLNRGPFIYSAARDVVYGNENDIFSFRIQSTGRGGP